MILLYTLLISSDGVCSLLVDFASLNIVNHPILAKLLILAVWCKGMSAENCLLEFGQLLQMGHDLVGPQAHPLLPDSHISASSYFNERAEYGKQQMWRSRLDCIDSCWVGKPKDQDPNPWLLWQFSSCREIRAIGTKGRPDTDSWASSSVDQSTPCREALCLVLPVMHSAIYLHA